MKECIERDDSLADASDVEDSRSGSDAGEDASDDAINDAGHDEVSDVRDVGGDGDEEPWDSGDTGASDVTRTDTVDCAEVVFEAFGAERRADIIWVIDTSESMLNIIATVQENINAFATRIGSSGVDYRVVMVASKEARTRMITVSTPFGPIRTPANFLGVCVPPPLSAAATCPDIDNPPSFMHADIDVYSTDALLRLIEGYPQYESMLRSWAPTHIIVVTDDRSDWDASRFMTEASRLPAPGFGDFTFHSLVNRSGDTCGDGPGDRYEALSNATGGEILSICRDDWAPVFEALIDNVVGSTDLPCAYGIPDPGEGFDIDPEAVNVYLSAAPGDDTPTLLLNVPNVAACGSAGGWYFDDSAHPGVVFICPSVCGDGVGGSIEITFGCTTAEL